MYKFVSLQRYKKVINKMSNANTNTIKTKRNLNDINSTFY